MQVDDVLFLYVHVNDVHVWLVIKMTKFRIISSNPHHHPHSYNITHIPPYKFMNVHVHVYVCMYVCACELVVVLSMMMMISVTIH